MLSSFFELSQICHKVSAPRHAEAQGESKTVIKSESITANVCCNRFRFNCRNVDGLLSTTTAVVQLCCYCSTGTCTVDTTCTLICSQKPYIRDTGPRVKVSSVRTRRRIWQSCRQSCRLLRRQNVGGIRSRRIQKLPSCMAGPAVHPMAGKVERDNTLRTDGTAVYGWPCREGGLHFQGVRQRCRRARRRARCRSRRARRRGW